jgi:membrane protein YdbS with pleckstrin-like domain
LKGKFRIRYQKMAQRIASDTLNADYQVEFDHSSGSQYLCFSSAFLMLFSGICIPCIPCACICSHYQARAQQCTIDDQRIQFKSGWLNKSDQWIPLDRIQDVTITRPWLCGCIKVANVQIQTAGGGGNDGDKSAATLVAPKNVEEVRSVIINKRDRLVLGGQSGGVSGHVSHQPGAGPEMVQALVHLTETIQKLDKRLESKGGPL